jgi:hypothetical protein
VYKVYDAIVELSLLGYTLVIYTSLDFLPPYRTMPRILTGYSSMVSKPKSGDARGIGIGISLLDDDMEQVDVS